MNTLNLSNGFTAALSLSRWQSLTPLIIIRKVKGETREKKYIHVSRAKGKKKQTAFTIC